MGGSIINEIHCRWCNSWHTQLQILWLTPSRYFFIFFWPISNHDVFGKRWISWFGYTVQYYTPKIIFKPFRSPILPPIQLSSPPSKKIRISSCVSNAAPQLLQPNLHSVVTAKKKRLARTFQVKDAVYKAVKGDGMSITHAASVFGISGGKLASRELFFLGPIISRWDLSAVDLLHTSCYSWRLQWWRRLCYCEGRICQCWYYQDYGWSHFIPSSKWATILSSFNINATFEVPRASWKGADADIALQVSLTGLYPVRGSTLLAQLQLHFYWRNANRVRC